MKRALLLVLLPLGSTELSRDDVCRIPGPARTMPAEVRETSGLAQSRRYPELVWTHNDSGNDDVLYGIDSTGAIVARVPVNGVSTMDWEDLALGPCGAGHCLYIADIGDNARIREAITVYVVPEPELDAKGVDVQRRIDAKYPDGAQDAEALFVLPDGTMHVVTKGRHGDIALYRFPKAGGAAGQAVTLERVRTLFPQPRTQLDRVTSAAASGDGRWVAIRTYRTLYLYQAEALQTKSGPNPLTYDLRTLKERQGESVTFTDKSELRLTSEAEKKRDLPTMARLQCELQ
jgi:hypothetical protein